MNENECKISDNPTRQKWYKLSRKGGWSLEFLKKNIKYINWNDALLCNNIDSEILMKIEKNICWEHILQCSIAPHNQKLDKYHEYCARAIMSKHYSDPIKYKISEETVRKYEKYLDIGSVLKHNISNFSAKFIDEYSSFINSDILSWLLISHKTLPEWFLVKYKEYLDYSIICHNNILSDEFIDSNIYRINWYSLCINQNLSSHIISKYIGYLGIDNIFAHQKINEKFIEDNFNDIKSDLIYNFIQDNPVSEEFRKFNYPLVEISINTYKRCKYEKLTEDEILIMHDNITIQSIQIFCDEWFWILMFKYQKLSDKFIMKQRKNIHWKLVYQYQKMDHKLLCDYDDEIYWDWSLICRYQRITDKTINQFADLIDYNALSKNPKFKRKIMHDLSYKNISIHNKLCDMLNCDLVGIVKQYLYV